MSDKRIVYYLVQDSSRQNLAQINAKNKCTQYPDTIRDRRLRFHCTTISRGVTAQRADQKPVARSNDRDGHAGNVKYLQDVEKRCHTAYSNTQLCKEPIVSMPSQTNQTHFLPCNRKQRRRLWPTWSVPSQYIMGVSPTIVRKYDLILRLLRKNTNPLFIGPCASHRGAWAPMISTYSISRFTPNQNRERVPLFRSNQSRIHPT